MKLGTQAQEASDKAAHPLSIDDCIEIARCMVWDGNADMAYVLVQQAIKGPSRNSGPRWSDGSRDSSAFYRLLGMSSVLAGVLGDRVHRAEMRAIRASNLRPRRARKVA